MTAVARVFTFRSLAAPLRSKTMEEAFRVNLLDRLPPVVDVVVWAIIILVMINLVIPL